MTRAPCAGGTGCKIRLTGTNAQSVSLSIWFEWRPDEPTNFGGPSEDAAHDDVHLDRDLRPSHLETHADVARPARAQEVADLLMPGSAHALVKSLLVQLRVYTADLQPVHR